MAAVSVLLAIILWIVGGVLGLLLLLVGALLLFPLNWRARLDADLHEDEESDWGYGGYARWAGDAGWGWRFVRLRVRGDGPKLEELTIRICGFRVRLGGKAAPSKPTPQKPDEKKPKAKKKKRRQRPSFDDLRSYFHEGLQLVRRLIASLRLRLRGDLTFGFSDPSITGIILAFKSVTQVAPELRLQPDWLSPGVHGWVETEGRVYGFEVVAPAWTAFWRSPMGVRLWQRIRYPFHRSIKHSGGRTA